mmetsp:Transcript_51934/g.137166  ORF Transcript_51934/g.137166 Transcript_51934/m.137166 type:complete len:131 (+) Transcript_51934:224-616(+)
MKPDWSRLAETWKDSTHILIGDVDCHSPGGKPVCLSQGVDSYPLMRYYIHGEDKRRGKPYRGGRSFQALQNFTIDLAEDRAAAQSQWSNSEIALASLGVGVATFAVVGAAIYAWPAGAEQGLPLRVKKAD